MHGCLIVLFSTFLRQTTCRFSSSKSFEFRDLYRCGILCALDSCRRTSTAAAVCIIQDNFSGRRKPSANVRARFKRVVDFSGCELLLNLCENQILLSWNELLWENSSFEIRQQDNPRSIPSHFRPTLCGVSSATNQQTGTHISLS